MLTALGVGVGSGLVPGFGRRSPGPPVWCCDSISALPTFPLVADHEFGRLILLSGDTSGTDLEFTASRITKH